MRRAIINAALDARHEANLLVGIGWWLEIKIKAQRWPVVLS